MLPIKETNKENWTKQIWEGNPSLNLVCSCKLFSFHNRTIPVWIFGGTNEYPNFNFCVSGGANSDYSYTGLCDECSSLEQSEIFVDKLNENKKLIY